MENLSLSNFDWDAYEEQKRASMDAEERRKQNELFEKLHEGAIIEGTVISINKREVVVNVGYHTDGIVPAAEFRYNPELKLGDKVDVYIVSPEDIRGQLILSHKEARAIKAWDRVNEAYNAGEIVVGFIKWRVNAGLMVDVLGMDAFLPGSQIDVKPIRDFDALVGKTMEFKILSIDPVKRNVVVSHRALIEPLLEAQKKEFLSKLQQGQILEGTVKSFADFGVFVDLGGVDGLIHVNNLSWCRFNDPHDLLQIGQKINVVVLDITEEGKVALSLKHLIQNPWKNPDLNLEKGEVVPGTIISVKDTYAIASLKSNITGIIPLAEMTWDRVPGSISGYVHKGETISLCVKEFDKDDSRLVLSLKQAIENPVKKIADTLVEPVEITVLEIDEKKRRVKADYQGHRAIIARENLSINKVINMAEEVFVGEHILVKCIGMKGDDTLEFSRRELEEDLYPSYLYELSLHELLKSMGISTNQFVARAKLLDGDKVLLTNIAVVDGDNADRGRLLVDPITGKNCIIVTNQEGELYVQNAYYRISLGLGIKDYRIKTHAPYQFTIKGTPKLINDPYREAVELAYTKHTSPGTNQSVARLLDEVGENLYTSKKRMFFELLQNADDAAAKDGVQFNVETTDEYLIVTHNGLSFNLEDFESIISAAKSTKRANQKKTGYKGIGFKSVFTGTKKVLIHTGGLFFSFDSQHEEFNHFEQFYFKVNGCKTAEDREQILRKYRNEKATFRGVQDIPWQLLPIWETEIPEDLLNTSFYTSRANVAIAIKKSEISINDANRAINEVLSEPLFLLFLRNTKRVQLTQDEKTTTVKKVVKGNIADIITSNHPEYKYSFNVRNEDDIIVSDEAFEACRIPIKKSQELIPGQDEKEDILIQVDEQSGSSAKIEVPNRIAGSTSTTISYAIPLDANGIISPIQHTGNTLFAYLPMDERAYRFKFYINADFIPTSDREGVQTNNPWNWYLFYQIGTRLPRWIAQCASPENPHYLDLLQAMLFPEDELSQHFNRGYLQAIKEVPFILNEEGNVVKQDQIIIDKTGLSDIIGSGLFCQILNTERRLPHPSIDTTILEKSKDGEEKLFDQVEIVRNRKVCSLLINNPLIKDWLSAADEQKRLLFFDWLSDNSEYCEEVVKTLPIFKFGEEVLTLEEIKTKPNYIITTEHIAPLRPIFKNLGFECSSEIISEHPLRELITCPTEKSVFEKIIAVQACAELSAEEKCALVLGLQKFNDVGPVSVKSFPIFKNQEGTATPLSILIHSDKEYLKKYSICDQEYSPSLDELLLQDQDVFRVLLSGSYMTDIITDDNTIDIYRDYGEEWTNAFWKELVNKMSPTTLLPIIQNAPAEVINLFLEKIPDIHLDKAEYAQDDYEYKLYEIANQLGKNEILLKKTYIDSDLVSQYSINDNVSITADNYTYVLHLSEILPTRKTHVMQLFQQRLPFVTVNLVELDKNQIANEIAEELNHSESSSITPAQFVFICLWNYSRNNFSYTPCSADQVKEMNSRVIDCLDYCFAHGMSRNLPQFKKSDFVNWSIYGKYFDIPDLLLDEERLSPAIQAWADTTEKKDFLYKFGVEKEDNSTIKKRTAFWEGSEYDGDSSASRETFKWMASVSAVKLAENADNRENRINLLKRLLEYSRRKYENRSADICQRECHEWEGNDLYTDWKNDRGITIYICPNGVPCELIYEDYTFCILYDDREYISGNDIYVSGKLDIQDAMNHAIGQTFKREDWYNLFSVSTKDYQTLQEKYDELYENYQRITQGGDFDGKWASFSADDDDEISKQKQKEAQLEAQLFLKDMKRGNWIFPEGFAQLDEKGELRCFSSCDVVNGDGEKMPIIIKSYIYQQEPFKINPIEWDKIAKEGAHLFIYTGNDVVEISLDDIVREQTRVVLSFNTINMTKEDAIQQFSDALHYFNDIHFNFESFNLTKKAQSIRNMYNKHEGGQSSNSDDDL